MVRQQIGVRMILDEFIDLKLSGNSIKHYKDLGYEIPMKYSEGKRKVVCDYSVPVKVKVSDLPKGSHVLINVQCDFCRKKTQVTYRAYYKNCIEKNTLYACFDCGFEKQKSNNIKKYGVENQMQLESFREKSKATNLEKYGVEYIMQSEKFRKKAIQTSYRKYGFANAMQNEDIKIKLQNSLIDKYGESNPMKVDEIKEKSYKTNLKRYGVKNVLQSPKIRGKISKTMMERYGVEYPSQNKEIAKRISETRYLNGNVKTSKQQLYLNEIYNGELNYPCGKYNIDIFINKENIAIEYDGGGHNLTVTFNQKTQKEFDVAEIIRGKYLKKQGIKTITIISLNDKLPSDETLLNILDISKQYFLSTNHTWIEWTIDKNQFRNAENLNGSFFDYGKTKQMSRSK